MDKAILRNPSSTRPWQHVLEALFGYLTFSIKLKKNHKLHGEAFNFGPNNKINKNVLEVVGDENPGVQYLGKKLNLRKTRKSQNY